MDPESTSTAPKFFCFVLMPFESTFDDVYKFGIKDACTAAGAYCERLDEQIFSERMLDRIYNQIAKCDLVIADMTGRNANVFYEVGYAHALDKATLLVTKNASDIPFDLKHFPHVIYESSLSTLSQEVKRRVAWFIDNPRSGATHAKVEIDLYLKEQDLSLGNVSYTTKPNYLPRPIVTLINASSRTLEPGELKVGVITSDRYDDHSHDGGNSTWQGIRLPSGKILHMWEPDGAVLPGEPVTIDTLLVGTSRDEPASETLIYRVFTSAGSRDFPLTITETK